MKVGLLGNMNNILFTLTRYLRDAGIDATQLLFDNEFSHFTPDNDCFEPADTDGYVRSLTWGNRARFSQTSARQIVDDLRPYDYLIGCGTAPAYVSKAGRQLDAFVPFGGDIYRLPFHSWVHLVRMPRSLALVAAQRKAIETCPIVMFNATNPDFEKCMQRLDLRGERSYYTPPMLYHPEYEPARLARFWPQHPHYDILSRLRDDHEFLIIQHGRQYWRGLDTWSLKGNDRLFKGYKQFLTENPTRRAHMVLVEYGKNVPDSKALIRSLGLEKHVTWLPLMSRKWIMAALPMMDVVVGELYRSWLTYGVACEAMCAGRPLLKKRDNAFYAPWYDALYPMFHAEQPNDIAAALDHAVDHPAEARRIGEEGRKWLLDYGTRRPVQIFLDRINAA